MLAGAVIGLACSNPTGMCGCPPTPLSGTVFGRAQTAIGAPVPNATVLAYIAQGSDCGRRPDPDGMAVTRGDGTYTVNLAGIVEDEAACVLVHVRAPQGSSLRDAPDTTVTVAIRSAAPFDSTRVDATFSGP